MKTLFKTIVYAATAFAIWSTAAFSSSLPEKKQTMAGQYLTAIEAAEFLQDPAVLLIDVRSQSELMFVGLADRVTINIPYMTAPIMGGYNATKAGYGLELNPEFREDFIDFAASRELDFDTPIVLICRSGSRSAKAADVLYQMGYTNVYSVIDGFEGDKAKEGEMAGLRVVNGWKNAGLPWGYKIAPTQVYLADR